MPTSGRLSESVAAPTRGQERHLVSVVIPCLNEAGTITECVMRARQALDSHRLPGEVLVVDNGSDDGSGDLARAAGARVVVEPRRGYGSAYVTGLAEARGDYLVLVDADLTYDLDEIPNFVAELERGAQLVMGDRMSGIEPGAMPRLSRLGNPILSGFLNLLFRTGVRDVHCGMRALRRDVLPQLNLHTTGMEFASEMVIRAAKERLVITEIPIRLHPRGGESKLSPLRDGWRHLRLILVYSPNFLFLLPGVVMLLFGLIVMAAVLAHVSLFGRQFYIHTLIGGSMLVIIGTQMIGLCLCARAYAFYYLGERDRLIERARARLRLEHGLLLGVIIGCVGLAVAGVVAARWASNGFGTLSEARLAVVAATAAVTGFQIFFTSFLLSLLGLGRSTRDDVPRG
jgi:glycosyltransferase involved in cell wall biosynthesis